MNKILLSGLAGLVVISTANAGIKETCLQHSDKLVWVEKTERCVPINPCESDDENIKEIYCPQLIRLPHDKFKQELVINEYVQNVLYTGVAQTKEIDENYISVKTLDGNYFVWKISKYADDHCLSQMLRAFYVYGYVWDDLNFEDIEGETISYSVHVHSERNCNQIINFASSMAGKDFKNAQDGNKCILICSDRTF